MAAEKQQRKRKTEQKWRENEERWRLYKNLKLIKFKKSSRFQVYKFFSLCSGQFCLYEMNETNLAQHFTSHFSIQFVYQETF